MIKIKNAYFNNSYTLCFNCKHLTTNLSRLKPAINCPIRSNQANYLCFVLSGTINKVKAAPILMWTTDGNNSSFSGYQWLGDLCRLMYTLPFLCLIFLGSVQLHCLYLWHIRHFSQVSGVLTGAYTLFVTSFPSFSPSLLFSDPSFSSDPSFLALLDSTESTDTI